MDLQKKLDSLDKKDKLYLLKLIEEQKKRELCLMYALFPEKDTMLSDSIVAYSKDKYPKHMQFFREGKNALIRVFRAGNRCGKSYAGADEMAFHLTGQYPADWEGRKFDRPIKAWAASTTAVKTKEIIQFALLGSPDRPYERFIPEHLIEETTTKPGTPKAIGDVYVKHVSGGLSVLSFKDYMQERAAFEGQRVDVIWLDEEAPKDIFDECKARIMNTSGKEGSKNGLLYLTFTPLQGLTPLISYLMAEAGKNPSIKMITAEWDDVPHLTEEAKQEMLSGMPPHIRDARMRGIPFLGTGQIYSVPLQDVLVDNIKILPHWGCAYGLDEGFTATAGCWIALDPDTDVMYVYDEYMGRNQLAMINARAVNIKGNMRGVVDTSAFRTSPTEAIEVITEYENEGLDLVKAIKSVEPGINSVWERLATGRLKICRHCYVTRAEYDIYHRNDQGEPVRTNIHMMDALRYVVHMIKLTNGSMLTPFEFTKNNRILEEDYYDDPYSGMLQDRSRNKITGY